LFDLKQMAPNTSRKIHEDLFWRSYQNKVFMISDLCGEILSAKSYKTLRASLENSGKYPLPPKICSLLNLSTSTDFQTKTGWCSDTKETESHFE